MLKTDHIGDLHRNETGSTEEYPIYSEEGIDLTLIRWMLSLTPTERLLTLQHNLNAIEWLRHGTIHR